MDCFTFGDYQIAVDLSEFPLKACDAMDVFRDEFHTSPDLIVRGVRMVPDEFRHARMIFEHDCWEMLDTPKGRCIMQHWTTCRHAYGIYLDELLNSRELTVHFAPDLPDKYPLTRTQVVFSTGVHHHLLKSGAAILHASYIDAGGEAILFTAPSGTGKSTQAELWRQFGGAEVINGDRAIIRQREGIWHAFGTPCSGSSRICLNRTLPLRAIVVLEQYSENVIERMTYAAKLRALVAATEVYPWLPEEIDMAFGIAQQIVSQVPVIRLRCRPDQGAVECLKRYLEENR